MLSGPYTAALELHGERLSRKFMSQLLRPYAAAAAVAGIVAHDLRVWLFFENHRALRFQNQDQRIERASIRDGIGSEFWWRWGKTGGMVQLIGSNII
jgi:hypothetical protein